MKRLHLLLFSLFFTILYVNAIPAKKGVKRTITLSNGTSVEAELCGDEFASYWRTDNGNMYIKSSDGVYKQIELPLLLRKTARRRNIANKQRTLRLQKGPNYASINGSFHSYTGSKKGLIILVQFPNQSFGILHNQRYYNRLANTIRYSSSNYKGSLKDYFLAQSNGKFELDFDVVGPYTVSQNSSYYGADNGEEHDVKVGNMIYEALQLAEGDVNYADYDWDGDKNVEQVYVLYAGKGQADGGDDDTIWPHEYQLEYTSVGKKYVTSAGDTISTYACGNELNYINQPTGIGTICHEFSHCLGYPDTYDTSGNNYGMGRWDVMDQGSYNGNGYCPPNYTAYEKWIAGWITPTTLSSATTVKGMTAQDVDYGQTFVIYNDSHPDEYYLLENRQNSVGVWDKSLPGSGLMITHIDYNQDIWEWNNVNAIVNYSETYGEQYAYLDNDHQRMTIFQADNSDSDESADLYPYEGNDSLTDASLPAANIYNDGAFMGKPITNITKNADGSIDFDFMGGSSTNVISGIKEVMSGELKVKNQNAYNLSGQRVPDSYQGIVIRNGKKYVKK